MENNIYCDPNAFIKREIKEEKPKIDLMHIEKVLYPINYNDYQLKPEKPNFAPPAPPTPPPQKCNNGGGFGFDISKLLPLLSGGKGDLSSMLPSLLSNLGMGKDILPLLSNFTGLNKPQKTKSCSIENKDSISKYRRV